MENCHDRHTERLRTLVSAAVHPAGSHPFALPRRGSYKTAVGVTFPRVPASTTSVSASSAPPSSKPSLTRIFTCASSENNQPTGGSSLNTVCMLAESLVLAIRERDSLTWRRQLNVLGHRDTVVSGGPRECHHHRFKCIHVAVMIPEYAEGGGRLRMCLWYVPFCWPAIYAALPS